MSVACLSVLEWAITLSGLVAFWLAMACWLHAYDELLAIRARRLNGELLAAVKHHLWRSSMRAIPAVVSFVCGIWLILLPNGTDEGCIIKGVCWLLYQLAMIVNLLIERWSRAQVRP